MKTEPLIRQARKAYLQTEVAAVEKLLAEEQRWRRKQTIASNKLADIRKEIDDKLYELAQATTRKDSPCEQSNKPN